MQLVLTIFYKDQYSSIQNRNFVNIQHSFMLLNLISKFRNCYLAHYFKTSIIQLLINNLFHLFHKEIEFVLTKMVAQIEDDFADEIPVLSVS
jgi:hypothetical protein